MLKQTVAWIKTVGTAQPTSITLQMIALIALTIASESAPQIGR